MQRQGPFALIRKGVFCLSYAPGRLFSSAADARCSAAAAPDAPEAADVALEDAAAVAVVEGAAVAARDEAQAGPAAPDGMPAAGAPAAVPDVVQV